MGLRLSVILLSNPCNHTGQVIQDEELKKCVKIAKKLECTFIFDELSTTT